MRLLAILVLLVVATPAAAVQGLYRSGDGSVRVSVNRIADNGIEVVFEGTRLGAAQVFTLYPDSDQDLLVEKAATLGWFERLMGREAERLPFDGKRLAFARETADRLVMTTLVVDDRGRPTLDRVVLAAAGDKARLEHQRFTKDGLETFEPVELSGDQP